MRRRFIARRARVQDALPLQALISEWLEWEPRIGRTKSIKRAITNKEFFVAGIDSELVGFIHCIIHEDVIDGAPNAFITAFYVSEHHRGQGIGAALLAKAVADALARGAVGIETSTIHSRAKAFYEKHHFRQVVGDIGEVFLELDLRGAMNPMCG